MADKTGYNQFSEPKYSKEEILTLTKTCKNRTDFRNMALCDMAIREGILEECLVIVDKNKEKLKDDKKKKVDDIIHTIRSLSDFKRLHPKLHYFTKHHYPEAFKKIIRQKFSTQQIICKKILESLIGVSCIYNDRSTLGGKELDILFPSQKIACEYNSFFWHEHRSDDDQLKSEECKRLGIYLIIIKEPYLNAYNTIANSIEGIKNQMINHLEEINKHTSEIKTDTNIREIEIDRDNLLDESYSRVDIDHIVNHCNRYSEVKTKHNKIWQYLLRNNLLHILDPVKKRDYIYMNKSETLNHVIENFPTYTDFVQHKIYQLVRKRGFLQDVKDLYS